MVHVPSSEDNQHPRDEAFKAGDMHWARNRYDNLLYLQSRQQEALNNAGLRVNTTHDLALVKDNLNMRTEINHALGGSV